MSKKTASDEADVSNKLQRSKSPDQSATTKSPSIEAVGSDKLQRSKSPEQPAAHSKTTRINSDSMVSDKSDISMESKSSDYSERVDSVIIDKQIKNYYISSDSAYK